MEFLKHDGCMNTFTGKKISFLNPKAEDIDIYDIAKGLAYRPHFGGQTPEFFSVAQHSILVDDLMLAAEPAAPPKKRLCALLHDGSEAYSGDMLKPLKNLIPEFQKIEKGIQNAILQKWGIDPILLKEIKPYDIEAQNIEYQTFFKGSKSITIYLQPEQAFQLFIERYFEIIKKME